MSKPVIVILPAVGLTSHVRLLKVVDLPAPFTPNRQKHSPTESPNESFSTAKNGRSGLQGPLPII